MNDGIDLDETQNDDEVKRLSPKEFAKLQRRKAYLRAKEQQKADPKFAALKERARQRRREVYQKHKEQIKAKKKQQKLQDEKRKDQEQKVKDAALLAQLTNHEHAKPHRHLSLVKSDSSDQTN